MFKIRNISSQPLDDTSNHIFLAIVEPYDEEWYLTTLIKEVEKQGYQLFSKKLMYMLYCNFDEYQGTVIGIKLKISDNCILDCIKVVSQESRMNIEAPIFELNGDEFKQVSKQLNLLYDFTEKAKYDSISKIVSDALTTVNNKSNEIKESDSKDSVYIATAVLLRKEFQRILPFHNISVMADYKNKKRNMYGKSWRLIISKTSLE